MSVCVTVRTRKRLSEKSIFKCLREQGEDIVTTSDHFPDLCLGRENEALRGVEVHKETDGYLVRVTVWAALADFLLFGHVVAVLVELTGGTAWFENEHQVDDPLSVFNEEWARAQRARDFGAVRYAVWYAGAAAVLDGLFGTICVGPKLCHAFRIPLRGDYSDEDMDALQTHLRYIQWLLPDWKGTATDATTTLPDGEDRTISYSLIGCHGDQVMYFDYISYADFFAISTPDNEQDPVTLLPFTELWKILPDDMFRPIDELQYMCNDDITADTVREMKRRARKFEPDDLTYKPTRPGEGYDERQRTFILMWNPAISSVTLEEHNKRVGDLLISNFNWSVWEHEQARLGDRFFMARVGEGCTGLVMSGTFTSRPYEADDWSGHGRRTFYMEMRPNLILNPDRAPMITTEQIAAAIPTFDWTGGHSGRMLTEDEARAMEALWAQFISDNHDRLDGETMNGIYIQ